MTRNCGSHLTYEDRCHIQAYLNTGNSRRSIAKLIGCSHTTINKEIHRNKGSCGYRHKQANARAVERRFKASSRPKKLLPELISLIQSLLINQQWSPVQISGRLRREEEIKISHESIYKLVWRDKKEGGNLYKHLRHQAKKYNRRSGKKAGRGLIPNRRDISERPEVVNKKERFGDFELDTIVGAKHQGAIVSIVERVSKHTFLCLVPQATAVNVTRAVKQALGPLSKKSLFHSATSDNGKEFSGHEQIVQELGGAFYFARPYHSWERGLNEHTNGLVRQYFPKGTDFVTLTQDDLAEVERKLNHRPRKVLNFETPFEVLTRLTQLPLSGNFQC
jgi:IS30 family transposase